MLFFILYAAGFLTLAWTYGNLSIRPISSRVGNAHENVDWLLTFLIGFVSLTTLANLLSLVIPLNWVAFLILCAGAGLIIILDVHNHRLRLPWRNFQFDSVPAVGWVLLGLVLISILENVTHVPTNFDSGLYHAQTIHWFESYPIVPGLGNLHSRLAFNSSWLVLQAAFSLAFSGIQSFHLLPGILYLLAALDFTRGVIGLLQKKITYANVLRALFLPFSFYVLGSEISSPGTDLPTLLILWLIATAWLENPRSALNRLQDSLLAVLCFYLITIKLSAGIFLLLTLVIWLRQKPSLRYTLQLAVLGVIVWLPWIVHSIILSGYVIYPLAALDFFNLAWKIPVNDAHGEADIIRAWARFPGMDTYEVLAMPLRQWLKAWFLDHTTNQRIILAAAGVAPWITLALSIRVKLVRQKFSTEQVNLLELAATSTLAGLYWLLSAPDLRFGYGIILLLLSLPMAWIFTEGIHRFSKITLPLAYLLAVGAIVYQAVFFLSSVEPTSLKERWLLPKDYPALPSEPCNVDGDTILCAAKISNTQCWYAPFPCLPQPNSTVRLLGNDVSDGFLPAEKK